MRTLVLEGGDARSWGRQHGETYRGEIQSLVEIRRYLTSQFSRLRGQELDAVAAAHLPILRDFDPEAHDELLGIAEGAAITPSCAVIVNHYTDLRDLQRIDRDKSMDYEGGCTMFHTLAPEGPILAQTWDMHATASPYVMMLRVPKPFDTWVLTVTGCLGMAGMNRAGVCVGINNLTSLDAQVGLVWPALVRNMLRETQAAHAHRTVLEAPLGSGHHYLVADSTSVFGIETSGQKRVLTFSGGDAPYVHANHCHDTEVDKVSVVPAGSTTRERETRLQADLVAKPVVDLDDAWQRLGSHQGYPRSVCTNMATPVHPHASATCAGIAMSPRRQKVYAVAGFTHNVAPNIFDFEPTP